MKAEIFYPVFDAVMKHQDLPIERDLFLNSRGKEWRQARRITVMLLRNHYKLGHKEICNVLNFKHYQTAHNLFAGCSPDEKLAVLEISRDRPPLSKAETA